MWEGTQWGEGRAEERAWTGGEGRMARRKEGWQGKEWRRAEEGDKGGGRQGRARSENKAQEA